MFARGPNADAYFIRGRGTVWMAMNVHWPHDNKLCLFRRDAFAFPPVDLDIEGMGGVEGHYQPVALKEGARIAQLGGPVIHYNRKGRGDWLRRHARYAVWEAEMIKRNVFQLIRSSGGMT